MSTWYLQLANHLMKIYWNCILYKAWESLCPVASADSCSLCDCSTLNRTLSQRLCQGIQNRFVSFSCEIRPLPIAQGYLLGALHAKNIPWLTQSWQRGEFNNSFATHQKSSSRFKPVSLSLPNFVAKAAAYLPIRIGWGSGICHNASLNGLNKNKFPKMQMKLVWWNSVVYDWFFSLFYDFMIFFFYVLYYYFLTPLRRLHTVKISKWCGCRPTNCWFNSALQAQRWWGLDITNVTLSI